MNHLTLTAGTYAKIAPRFSGRYQPFVSAFLATTPPNSTFPGSSFFATLVNTFQRFTCCTRIVRIYVGLSNFKEPENLLSRFHDSSSETNHHPYPVPCMMPIDASRFAVQRDAKASIFGRIAQRNPLAFATSMRLTPPPKHQRARAKSGHHHPAFYATSPCLAICDEDTIATIPDGAVSTSFLEMPAHLTRGTMLSESPHVIMA
jgi:hypothetical protein